LILGLSGCSNSPTDQATGEQTEILWDQWGVPHIFAAENSSLFYALGWAQAKSHGNLILRLYGQARGRGAEYWGEAYLPTDRWTQTMGIPERTARWHEAQEGEWKQYLDAFAQGINDYAAEHPDQISDEVKAVLPVNGRDVLAHGQRVMLLSFITSPALPRTINRRWNPGQTASLPATTPGSNGWAIGPSRSASGNALLLGNPHLPWSNLYLFYEAHLNTPEMNSYGSTLVGIPVLAIAFNDYLGWTHTVNAHDGDDLYELTLAEGGYVWDGSVRAFETSREILKIREKDGTLREENLDLRQSIHGPVIAEKNGKALALRIVGLEQSGMIAQWWDMMRARNLEEFEAVLRRLQLPMFTVLYADRDGRILHLFGGITPVRPAGDWNWSGIVPGDTSETLWTEAHGYDELPKVIDPASGWLQNANDPPWTTTFPAALDANQFPRYMAPRRMRLRAQRSASMLMEDESITFEELIRYKHSTRVELADRLLDDLLRAAGQSTRDGVRRAAQVLSSWDRNANADSRGAVLFEAFVQELNRSRSESNIFAQSWSEDSPLETPNGLANPAAALEALETAADRVETDYGALDVEWGKIHRLRMGDLDFPANGGPDSLGIFRALSFRELGQGLKQATSGDSFVMAVEFSNPVRAQALLSYGNASQPDSPFLGDQLQLFSRKELRPVWRTRQEIEANLTVREVF
jgi:acyl-homoserine-lactone acylase